MPLNNNTVRRKIDEMSQNCEIQLDEMLKLRNFSIQMAVSTVRNSEVLLLAYVRYIDESEFAEEMLFCESLEITITTTDIYSLIN